jgi:hypothetical protein
MFQALFTRTVGNEGSEGNIAERKEGDKVLNIPKRRRKEFKDEDVKEMIHC